MNRILIRCDASMSIGTGHVFRCRTLARSLIRCGAEVVFLCRRQPGDLISLLQDEFLVLALPEQSLKPCEGLEGRDLYGAWLGCSQNQDANDCLSVLNAASVFDANYLVLDHYGLDATWQSQFLNNFGCDSSVKLLVIDDLADRFHVADLLLDQNFFGSSTEYRYKGLVPSDCEQLLGPQFALLGPEYAQFRDLVPVRKDLSRVLVFFGGVDSDNFTALALKALMYPNLAHLSVDVVLGSHSQHREYVSKLASCRPFTTLHKPLPSLAGLIARADLAIGAGGSTIWERACLKLPSLVFPIAANQLVGAQALHDQSCLMLMSTNDGIEGLADSINRLIAKPSLLSSLSIGSAKLADGHGSSILCEHMLGINGRIV